MFCRSWQCLVLLSSLLCFLAPVQAVAAGEHVTANFIVSAPNQQIARKVGEYAERWRREKAIEWLGREMPQWGKRCPLQVIVTPGGSSGETTFAFDQGSILDQRMQVSGSIERILDSVLPHEITHTVFAYKFRQPLPRWADEGGSVLSEDDHERRKHDELIRRFLAKGNQAYRLRTLMTMMTYPHTGEDVITLYAEGYSIVRFLVESSSKPAFLDFLSDGINPQFGWDRSLQKHYGLRNIEQLEQAWLKWMLGWCKAEALLQRHSTSGSNVAVSTGPATSNQSQAARVDTRNPAGYPITAIRGNDVGLESPPTNAAPRPAPADRPWSPVNDNAAPNSQGWKPLRASLGAPIPH